MENIRSGLSLPYEVSLVAMNNMKFTACRHPILFLFFACSLSLSACDLERATSVTVAPGPRFTFSGSGQLAVFTIYGPQQGERISYPDPGVSAIVWRIQSSAGYFAGQYVSRVRLTYGQVPQGYIQMVPNQEQAAPPLAAGLVYSFFAETSGAGSRDGFFYMAKDQPIQTIIPNLCLELLSGRETRVNCSDKQPYQEPLDLESIALAHRTNR